MKDIDELDALHAAATAGPRRMVFAVRAYEEWPAFSARLRAAEAEAERLRGLVRWFLDGDDHTHVDDCGARGQHDRDVCRVAGCGDAECEGPHCTCDATEMRDAARAALGEP